ncbi:hypothetical protein GEMRC1_003573 [Eukaryota sp. GEM-RC1]
MVALRYERQLLYTIGFKTNVFHPQPFIIDYLSKNLTAVSEQRKTMLTIVNRFLFDSYLTPLSLLYPPEFIAAGVLYVALIYTKFGNEILGGDLWYRNFHPEVTLDDLDRIAVILFKIYE